MPLPRHRHQQGELWNNNRMSLVTHGDGHRPRYCSVYSTLAMIRAYIPQYGKSSSLACYPVQKLYCVRSSDYSCR